MAAYVIFLREGAVHDPEAMAEYLRRGPSDIAAFKLTPLVVYGALETIEGDAPDGVVILQFPTVEDARTWYHSPGYQAASPFRRAAAEYRGFIVEGL